MSTDCYPMVALQGCPADIIHDYYIPWHYAWMGLHSAAGVLMVVAMFWRKFVLQERLNTYLLACCLAVLSQPALVLHDALILSEYQPHWFRFLTSFLFMFAATICKNGFWQVEISWATIQGFTEGIRDTDFRRNSIIVLMIYNVIVVVGSLVGGISQEYYLVAWRIVWYCFAANLLILFIFGCYFGFKMYNHAKSSGMNFAASQTLGAVVGIVFLITLPMSIACTLSGTFLAELDAAHWLWFAFHTAARGAMFIYVSIMALYGFRHTVHTVKVSSKSGTVSHRSNSSDSFKKRSSVHSV